MESGIFYIVHYYGSGNFGLEYGRNYESITIQTRSLDSTQGKKNWYPMVLPVPVCLNILRQLLLRNVSADDRLYS